MFGQAPRLNRHCGQGPRGSSLAIRRYDQRLRNFWVDPGFHKIHPRNHGKVHFVKEPWVALQIEDLAVRRKPHVKVVDTVQREFTGNLIQRFKDTEAPEGGIDSVFKSMGDEVRDPSFNAINACPDVLSVYEILNDDGLIVDQGHQASAIAHVVFTQLDDSSVSGQVQWFGNGGKMDARTFDLVKQLLSIFEDLSCRCRNAQVLA